jgi:hypothetical protein
MSETDHITVRVMTGRTPLGRRLTMVAGVDMVVTISGRQHTEVVVEQALELGVPLLPIPVGAAVQAGLWYPCLVAFLQVHPGSVGVAASSLQGSSVNGDGIRLFVRM